MGRGKPGGGIGVGANRCKSELSLLQGVKVGWQPDLYCSFNKERNKDSTGLLQNAEWSLHTEWILHLVIRVKETEWIECQVLSRTQSPSRHEPLHLFTSHSRVTHIIFVFPSVQKKEAPEGDAVSGQFSKEWPWAPHSLSFLALITRLQKHNFGIWWPFSIMMQNTAALSRIKEAY